MRLGGPQSRFGCCAEDKNTFHFPEIEPRFLILSAQSLVSVLVELYAELYPRIQMFAFVKVYDFS
jgi:hypothetical protein